MKRFPTLEDKKLIIKIAEKAFSAIPYRIKGVSLVDLEISLTACHLNGVKLDLERMLVADDINLCSDVYGINANINPKGKLRNRFLPRLTCMILAAFLFTGCGSRIAPDILTKTERLDVPLVESGFAITTEIDSGINNAEGIDNSVKESLALALQTANIFGDRTQGAYAIVARVQIASQSPVSIRFTGKLEVKYTLYDSNKVKVLDKTIYTEAGSDQFILLGAKRHTRARAVNIAQNVLQFTDHLKETL